MATYLAAQTRNSGSLGEQLNGVKTFIITNNLDSNGQYPVGYLTLEGNSTANKNLPNTTFITGNTSQFQFQPTGTIPPNSYYIKGTGLFDLEIV